MSYPARMTAAKLLIEVTSYDIASEILELLLDEEDQVVEVSWSNSLNALKLTLLVLKLRFAGMK